MNKQALAFLTMFSLILMLSVYYVTLPTDTTKVMSEDTSEQRVAKEESAKGDANETIADTSDSDTATTSSSDDTKAQNTEADKLQQSIDQKKDEEMEKQSAVVAQGDSEGTTKQNALTSIDTLKAQKELQVTLRAALKDAGYESAVEIKDGTCIVSVFEQEDSEALAKTIMASASKVTNQKYFVEVAFK